MSENERSFQVRLELRRKNARLVTAREETGLSQKDFAGRLGISQSTYCGYETMHDYPSEKHATTLAEFVGCSVEELFPPELREVAKDKGGSALVVREVSVAPAKLIGMARMSSVLLPSVPTPEDALMRESERQLLMSAVDALPPRTADMVRLYYGFDGDALTLKQLGEKYCVGAERVRNIIGAGVRKMRSSMYRTLKTSKPSREGFSALEE